MINFNSIPKDLSWFARRYNALLVEFPKELTPSLLEKDDLCSRYDSEEAYKALKSSYNFLTSIAAEMLSMPEPTEEKIALIEKVFSKIDMLWGLGIYSELRYDGNEYSITFKKPLKSGLITLPLSYSKSFQNITENGCWCEFFNGGEETKDFKACDNGVLHFDDRLTALGIYLFIKKCAQKRWYWAKDKAGGYTKKRQYTPVIDCVAPYRRADMRIFVCDERIKFNSREVTAGYNDTLKNCFYKICDHVEINYPDCMPSNHSTDGVTFGVDTEHRMIGQIGIGQSEDHLGVYAAMTGKEMETLLADIDSFGEKVVMQFLHESECACNLCKNKIGEIIYRGKKYNRVYKNTENRFSIENENDAELAIKCIDIKAECNMNTRVK